MNVFFLEGLIGLIVIFALLAVKIFAFASAVLYSAESYVAAGKLTKQQWCAILGVAVALQLMMLSGTLGSAFLSIINLAATIAALVYLADVRPALAGLRRR